MSVSVVVIATLDTKADEVSYFKKLVEEKGYRVIVVDSGILGAPPFPPDVTGAQIAAAAGFKFEEVVAMPEGDAVDAMAAGIVHICNQLFVEGKMDAVFCVGGTMGTSIGLAAMRDLPLGVPKFVMSTVALTPFIRGDMANIDTIVMPSVADFWGLNSVTKRMLSNTAGAIAGAAGMYRRSAGEKVGAGKKIVGITTLGMHKYVPVLKPALEAKGYEVLVFHATGGGGRNFESLIKQGIITAALDLATNELTNEICGGSYLSGSDRLENAGIMGIPQVVGTGAYEAFGWVWGPETLPPKYKRRKTLKHSQLNTAVRASRKEMITHAEMMAAKLNKAKGPVAVVIPMGGSSIRDVANGIWPDPQARKLHLKALRAALNPNIPVTALDVHINDQAYAEEVLRAFESLT
jgi:uncharacterized protein (UPF0261 family)